MAHICGYGLVANVVNTNADLGTGAPFSLIGTSDITTESNLTKFSGCNFTSSTATLTTKNTSGAGSLLFGNFGSLSCTAGRLVTLANTFGDILEMRGTFRVNSSGNFSSGVSIASSSTNTAICEIAAGIGINATGKVVLGCDNRKVMFIGCNASDTSNPDASLAVGSINIGTSATHNQAPINIGTTGRQTTIKGPGVIVGGVTSSGSVNVTGSVSASTFLSAPRITTTESANTAGQIGFVTTNTAVSSPTTWTQNGTSDTNPWRYVATISIPAKQVSLIIVSVTAQNNTVAVSNTRYGVVVSATQGTLAASDVQVTNSDIEIAIGLGSFTEPNMDSAVGVQDRRNLVGVYVNSSASTVTAYLNIQWKQAWTAGNAPTFSYNYSITKIG